MPDQPLPSKRFTYHIPFRTAAVDIKRRASELITGCDTGRLASLLCCKFHLHHEMLQSSIYLPALSQSFRVGLASDNDDPSIGLAVRMQV